MYPVPPVPQILSAFLAIAVGWLILLWYKKHYIDNVPSCNKRLLVPQQGDCPCGATTQGIWPTNIVLSADGRGLDDTSLNDADWEAKVEAVLADLRARQRASGA